MNFELSNQTKAKAIQAAEAIGQDFEAVRVDLIPDDSGEIWLNEITLSSNGGYPLQSRDRDLAMGRIWGACSFL